MKINAKQHIIDAGLRPTSARIAVLSVISCADSALSHSEILERLVTQKEFDRVTIYRVLDRLTHHHLVHKISGENRAWKFQISQDVYKRQAARLRAVQTRHFMFGQQGAPLLIGFYHEFRHQLIHG